MNQNITKNEITEDTDNEDDQKWIRNDRLFYWQRVPLKRG